MSKVTVTPFPLLLAALIATVLGNGEARAQAPILRPPPLLEREEKELQKPTPTPKLELPPVPASPKEPGGIPPVQVFVRDIQVKGSTVFSPEEIAQLTDRYKNRQVTTEDLERLRTELTLLYINKGYVNSGAILPDQALADGVVTYQIIEGKLTDIELEGNRWFRSSYLTKRISLGAGTPFNITELQERLRLLLEDQRIGRINAELKPGLRLGEAVLNVHVEDTTPYKLWLEFNNYQPPSVGAEQGLVTIEHQNLTGNGDIARVQYGGSQGLHPYLDAKYSLPVNAYDTTVSYQYRKNTLAVVQPPFNEIDVKSTSDIYTLGVRQPLYRTVNSDFAFELVGERLSYETFVLGERFTLSPGAHDGRSIVTAIRPTLEYTYRDESEVIAARSRFSFGLSWLDATLNSDNIPDSKFFAWLGEFQWVRRLGLLDSYFVFRSSVQLANDPLLSLEQVAIGGRYSVRGYQENTLLRDNAVLTSLEGRLPLLRNVPWADYLEIATFFDYGRGWNTKVSTDPPNYLASVGVGLRWGATVRTFIPLRPQFEIYWGHHLTNPPPGQVKNTLQDNGIHLQFVLEVF
jgi:hemolysin activation/secretion protein